MTESATPLPPVVDSEAAASGFLDQVRAIWKLRWLVLAVATAATALVALWTLRQPKIYAASVSIEFDPDPPRPLGHAVEEVDSASRSYWSTHEYYVTQFRVIQSERVAEGVVRQLGLQFDADFLGVPVAQRAGFHAWNVSDAAQVFRARLKVEGVKDSRLVNIAVEDTSPRRAQLLANTVADVYIRQNLESKAASSTNALEWLGTQRETLQTTLQANERGIQEYRQRNHLLSVSFEDRLNHVGNRVAKLSDDLTSAQTHRIAVQARVTELQAAVRAANHAATFDPLQQRAPELLSSVPLQNLRTEYETARRERDVLAVRYGEGARQMQEANSKLSEITLAIRDETLNVEASAEAELRAARVIESNLRSTLAQAQQEGLDVNGLGLEYGRLVRERDNNAKLYSLVLERTTETDLTHLLRVNNMRVLDNALVPGAPVRPKTLVNVAMGLAVGLLLGILTAFVALQADRTVRSPADVQEELHATFLGIIPRIGAGGGNRYRYRYGRPSVDEGPVTNPDLVVFTHPNSAIAEACRVIRTNLLFMTPDRQFQTLAVASANPREGKTTAAACLALTLAQSGKRVLLIDTDLRRPRVHKIFKMRPPIGMTSVLVNEATLDEAIFHTEVPNVDVLPCGPIPPNPAELLHSQRFQDVLAQVKQRYDRIVFDTPPVGAVTDALVIAPQVDGVVMVVRARSTVRARAANIIGQLVGIRARVLGVIINDVQTHKAGAGDYFYGETYDYRPRDEAA